MMSHEKQEKKKQENKKEHLFVSDGVSCIFEIYSCGKET
jgi:hypothetical protein